MLDLGCVINPKTPTHIKNSIKNERVKGRAPCGVWGWPQRGVGQSPTVLGGDVINILLVDSDKENIKNFRTYIRRGFSEFKIVGNFTDPKKDIIPVIKSLKPDLLLADIKFFGGVRFMRFKEVHDEFPNVRFLVYGTFNDTEYMRRARDFGVLDYMFRPVKPPELSRCLKLALSYHHKTDLERSAVKKQQERSNDNMSHYEGFFLRGLAEGHIVDKNEIAQGMSHFNIQISPGFTAFLVHIDHFRQIALTLTEGEKHFLIYKIFQTTVEAMAGREALTFMTGFNSVAVIAGGYYAIEDYVGFLDGLKQAVFEKCNTRVSIGLGRTYDDICNISISYKEAMAALMYRNRIGYNSVIPLEFVEPANKITYRYPVDREERLIYMAVVGDYAYCHQVLLELFDSLAQSGPLPEGLLPKVLMNIVIRISRYISEQNLPISAQVTRLFPASEILAVKNLEEAMTTFDKALRNFCTYVRTYTEEKHQRLFRTAKQYMDRNYRENFSTAKMAVSLGTTPEHLNKVFKDRERIGLFDYVMRVRMNEARRLLRETDMPEEEICVGIGFEDVRYFQSMFKQYENKTPSAYREELLAAAMAESEAEQNDTNQ